MIKNTLYKLSLKQDLTEEEAEKAFEQLILDPDPADIATFLTLLKSKGEKGPEIAGLVKVLRRSMIKVNVDFPVLDLVGTGGDSRGTINISTGSALLAATCGVPIAKHGTRSVSSLCGSADLIECLGIDLVKDPEKIRAQIENLGIAFLYAPHFNPIMKTFLPIRQRLGFRTVMNMLGPLLNPTEAEYLMVGAWDENLLPIIANALVSLNVRRALVFSGNGLDELTTIGDTKAVYVDAGRIEPMTINPEQLGFSKAPFDSLKGGDAAENKRLLIETLQGAEGPIADTLVLNAATALWLYGKTETIQEGIIIAKEALEKGAAAEKLNKWIHFEYDIAR